MCVCIYSHTCMESDKKKEKMHERREKRDYIRIVLMCTATF